jgi:hypothetical protein
MLHLAALMGVMTNQMGMAVRYGVAYLTQHTLALAII